MKLRTTLSTIPLRDKDTDRSEMVSQLLYGEQFEIRESKEKWMKVVCETDGYEGWLAKEHRYTDFVENTEIVESKGEIIHTDASRTLVSPGSRLTKEEISLFRNSSSFMSDEPVDTAMNFLNTPYLWGGRSIWGIDCSGLIQVSFACSGISLPRDAYQQAEHGEVLSFSDIQKGDLAFFHNIEGRINHVGIILGPSEILHASGYVRVDTLEKDGILRRTDNTLSHQKPIYRRLNI